MGNKIKPTSSNRSSEERETSLELNIVECLPAEIVQKILFKLSVEDLDSTISSCENWKEAVQNDDYFWKRVCQREYYQEVEESKRSEFYNNFLKKHSYWQGIYWYNRTLHKNWETNKYKEIVYEVEENIKSVWDWCLSDDTMSCANQDTKELHIFNLNCKTMKPTVIKLRSKLKSRDAPVDELVMIEKYVLTYTNSLLTLWDMENGSIIIDRLWNCIDDIYPYKNLLVMKSRCKGFKVYNIETGLIEYKSKVKLDNLVIMDGKIAYTNTTKDPAIHVLNWDDKSLVTFMCCNTEDDRTLLIRNDLLLSFCQTFDLDEDENFATLCVWNIATKTKLHSTYLGFEYASDLRSATFMNKYLLLIRRNDYHAHKSVYEKFIELWDYKKGTRIVSIANHITFRSFLSNDHFLITSRPKPWPTPNLAAVLWSSRKRDILYDLEFTKSINLRYRTMLITDTKLAYKINSRRRSDYCEFHIRDYEI